MFSPSSGYSPSEHNRMLVQLGVIFIVLLTTAVSFGMVRLRLQQASIHPGVVFTENTNIWQDLRQDVNR